ncbi:YHS domain-containing protein [Desulfobacula sp.]
MTHLNTNNKKTYKDPVCGMDVFSEKASITTTWKNQTFYFCAQHCREEFEKSPESYQKEHSFFLKKWWNNYLIRLNKVTNGKPQCCD